MKFSSLTLLLLFLCAGLLLPSCTLEKRHYRNGFYCDWFNKTATRSIEGDSVILQGSGDASCSFNLNPPVEVDSIPIAVAGTAETKIPLIDEAIASGIPAPEARRAVAPQDEKPPGNDKPNKKITLLTVFGILLVGCVALLLIPALPAGVMLLLYLCPLMGVGLYFLAKRMRQKTAYAIANGAKGPNDILSAHHYRFQLMLDLFFLFALIGGCFLLLGNYTNVIASGIIGAFGSVLTTACILLTCSIALILLVLLMFYIFRWRKDPSGYAPKRIRHPRKDG